MQHAIDVYLPNNNREQKTNTQNVHKARRRKE